MCSKRNRFAIEAEHGGRNAEWIFLVFCDLRSEVFLFFHVSIYAGWLRPIRLIVDVSQS